MKKVFKIIGDAIFYLFIVVMVSIIGLSMYGKKNNKLVFNYSTLWVMSESMEPDIPRKSYILVKKVNPNDIQVGDVITFISRDPAIAGCLNTHRVVSINDNHDVFTTKGDNNLVNDNYQVYAEDIQAIYVRNLGILTIFGRVYSSNAGLAFSLLFACAILAIGFQKVLKSEK